MTPTPSNPDVDAGLARMALVSAVTSDVRSRIDGLDPADALDVLDDVRAALSRLSPCRHNPVDHVRYVPIDKVSPNDYNPNSVARVEMGLLLRSIEADGYTQPVVTIYDPEADVYTIVDGFHRYYTMRTNEALLAKNHGRLPVVVIDSDLNGRMASTVRHNRARGKHSVDGMSNMVFSMLDRGMSDAEVCNELGMEPEELLRLKHVTGFSKLFEDADYNRAWMTRRQIQQRKAYAERVAAGEEEPKNRGAGGPNPPADDGTPAVATPDDPTDAT